MSYVTLARKALQLEDDLRFVSSALTKCRSYIERVCPLDPTGDARDIYNDTKEAAQIAERVLK